jgi:hypothetical protein
MGAPTDPGAAVACPVCHEPLLGRPARCFRCETPLGQWWSFEDALGAVRPAPAPRRAGGVPGWLAGAVIAGEILFFVGIGVGIMRDPTSTAVAPVAAPPRAPLAVAARPKASAPREPSPAVVRYRVQRGDSLWRIAAAFTGEGHRWRELWPQHARGHGTVRAGEVLEVEMGRLSRPPRQPAP